MNYAPNSNCPLDDSTLNSIHAYVISESDVLPTICLTTCIHVEYVTVKVRGFDPGDMEIGINPDGTYEEEVNYYCPKDTVIVPSVISPKESKWFRSPIMALIGTPINIENHFLDCR